MRPESLTELSSSGQRAQRRSQTYRSTSRVINKTRRRNMRFLAESASRPGGSSKPSSEGFLLFDHSDPKLLPLTVSFSWHLYPEDTSSQSQLRTRPREKPE